MAAARATTFSTAAATITTTSSTITKPTSLFFSKPNKFLVTTFAKHPLSDIISYPDDKDSIIPKKDSYPFHKIQNNSYPDEENHEFLTDDDDDDKPREECGVVGIYGDPEASRLCYLALHALQHRGQEGAGIVTATPDGILKSVTGVGLVSEVFNQSKLDQLPGDNAIGHVRYSTAGQSML
ncbi:amidophosphoribosyltransferase, chloroplastic-like protein, partial [Tanacetum coccineum]